MISQREADDIAFKNDLTGGNQCKIYVKSCNFEERNLVRISSVIKMMIVIIVDMPMEWKLKHEI